ncbi:MAG: class I SAM-dependent RNA methyltransferase [Betaproteobacteria bacterium]
MNSLSLFLPCAAGVQDLLAAEVERITGCTPKAWRAGVSLPGSWRDALQLNLHSRLAQRVLVQLAQHGYRNEEDLYNAAAHVAWEQWFDPRQTFKVELTAQHSPLQSLNFATLRIKDAVADRFRAKCRDQRPSVETRWPDARIHAHLTTDTVSLLIDTSGEPLFKRGWREDKGDAPLKETLAAAMIAASRWECEAGVPLYDPCCGSGTLLIEAAQIACHMAPGLQRRFGFEKLQPFQASVWHDMRAEAQSRITAAVAPVFGSDVSFRMVDFAQRNAERAGVAHAVQIRGGDALQRTPPASSGVMLLNPPYGERIEVAGVAAPGGGRRGPHRFAAAAALERSVDEFGQPTGAARSATGGRERAQTETGQQLDDFFERLAAHWKKHYGGWSAHVLTPDLKLPGKMRLRESRRVPMWNGPIECRLFRFDLVAGSARKAPLSLSPGSARP